MRHRPFAVAAAFFVLCCIPTVSVGAQGSAKELIAELESGDSTRCMDAGNATSQHQEHYQQLAPELATPLFDILENGPCSGSALTALVNVGDGVAEGVDGDRAMRALVTIVEKALAERASVETISDAGSAILVIGHFGEGGAPAVPVLVRWIRVRPDAFDRRYGLMTLAEIGDASAPAVPELLPFLAAPAEDDENAWEKNELRIMVAQTLGSIPAAAAVSAPALVAGLSDPDYNYRYVAGEAIAKIGPPMVPYLLPVLGSAEPETKKVMLEILSGMGTGAAEAAPAIAPFLADEDFSVTFWAGEVLRQIGPTPDGIAALVKVLGQESNEEAAGSAAEILGGYGSAARDALPALGKAAKSRKWSIANAAKSAIAAIEGGG